MIQARKRDRRNQLARHVRTYLLNHPCVDCGEADPVVLEFDHVRGIKVASVSRMVNIVVALPLLKAEIAKCEVRCANCHRRRTARTLGWNALFDDQASVVSAADNAAAF
jgi:hypothetical protein